jgi:Calcineurin-like phosphoesterase
MKGLPKRIAILALAFLAAGLFAAPPESPAGLSFLVAGDMRDYASGEFGGPAYFLGACQAMHAAGPSAFLIVPGDLDPPQSVADVIRSVFGRAFPWYPAVGNHDASDPADMAFLRRLNARGTRLPNIVRPGPPGAVETTYSFEVGDVHVAVLNQYFDGVSDTDGHGDVSDEVYGWLKADLAATAKPFIFVVGHEPAFPVPDMTTGRSRHTGSSLNRNLASRDRFWQLLKTWKVTAYFCGHTHGASAKKIQGVWQLDCGHARGKGDQGAPSTFMRVTVGGGDGRFEVFRADSGGENYRVTLASSLVDD